MQVDADGPTAHGNVYRAADDCDGLHSDAGGMSGFALVVWYEPLELWQPEAAETSTKEATKGFNQSPTTAGCSDDAMQHDECSSYGRRTADAGSCTSTNGFDGRGCYSSSYSG